MNVVAETAERSRSVALVLKRAGRDSLGLVSMSRGGRAGAHVLGSHCTCQRGGVFLTFCSRGYGYPDLWRRITCESAAVEGERRSV